MNELKPCPFCGAMPQCGVEFYESSGANIHLAATVRCISCGTSKRTIFKATDSTSFVPFSDYEEAFSNVIEAWNRRASDGSD